MARMDDLFAFARLHGLRIGTIAVGDELNLEVDVLGKDVERLIASRIASSR